MAKPNKNTYKVVDNARSLSFLVGKTVTSVVEYSDRTRIYYLTPDGKGEHVNILKKPDGQWDAIKPGNAKETAPGQAISANDKTKLSSLKNG